MNYNLYTYKYGRINYSYIYKYTCQERIYKVSTSIIINQKKDVLSRTLTKRAQLQITQLCY